MRAGMLIPILGLAACTSTPLPESGPIANRDYLIETGADDVSQTFAVSLQSMSNRDLCFARQSWPFPDGNWIGEGTFKIVSGDVSIAVPSENYGSCIGPSCTTRLKAHTKQTAKLNYAVFGEAGAITRLPDKRLEYSLALHFC